MTNSDTHALIKETRAILTDPDRTHDMSESDWIIRATALTDALAEYLWLREEAET